MAVANNGTPDSSVTAAGTPPPVANTDIEAQREEKPDATAAAPAAEPVHKRHYVNHFSLIFNPAGADQEAIDYKYPGQGTAENPYIVDFMADDARNPQTFASWKKWLYTLTMAVATLAIAFVSTAYTGGLREIIMTFHISTEVSILGVSLFVLGFAIGPLLWAPMSEFFGRQILFTLTYIALTAFNAGCAGAQNIQSLIILRFFAGAFGSSPLTNAGGVIADMFGPADRGKAAAIFAAAPFLGPSLGPIVSGFLGQAEGWRWVEGVMAIFTGVMLIAGTLIVPETYAPVLLRKRAAALSKKTGKVYVSKLDAGPQKKSYGEQLKIALSRPWILLFREPIVFITSLYMAIVYGTMYMMFAAFPIVFTQHRHWSTGISGLAFLGIMVGMLVAVVYALIDNKRYLREAARCNGAAPPESRLLPAIIGSVLIPIGLFWFAWTNLAPVHWVVSIIGSAFFAAGLVLVFLSLMNYLIDAYVVFAASVLAANAVLRSLFGAAFPLFTTYMYNNLGVHWASSIPAFLSLACVPFPIIFLLYGSKIRARCKYAAEAAEVLKRMRAQHRVINEDEAIHEVATRDEERKIERQLTRQASRASRASRHSSEQHRFSFARVRSSASRSGTGAGAAAAAAGAGAVGASEIAAHKLSPPTTSGNDSSDVDTVEDTVSEK